MEPRSPTLQMDSLPAEPQGSVLSNRYVLTHITPALWIRRSLNTITVTVILQIRKLRQERLSHLSKTTQLASGRTRIWTWLWSLSTQPRCCSVPHFSSVLASQHDSRSEVLSRWKRVPRADVWRQRFWCSHTNRWWAHRLGGMFSMLNNPSALCEVSPPSPRSPAAESVTPLTAQSWPLCWSSDNHDFPLSSSSPSKYCGDFKRIRGVRRGDDTRTSE